MVQLNFKTEQINNITGQPILNLTKDLIDKLGIKKDDDIEKFRDQIPKVTFNDSVNLLFDKISLATNKEFATYNNLLIDIRNAQKSKQSTIDIDKSEVELLKTIFEKGVTGKAELNRIVGFILETLDDALVAKPVQHS